MAKLDKTARKKIFFDILTPFFTSMGYKKYLTSGDPAYVLYDGKVAVKVFFNFFSDGTIAFSYPTISIYEIEDHILTIGMPNSALENSRKKEKYHLATVEIKQKLPDNLKWRPLIATVDIQDFARDYIKYYQEECIAFAEKYSHIPNIWNEIRRLEVNGGIFKDIVSGMGDAYIRALIISKLCNDPNYETMLKEIDSLFEGAPEWQPCWIKYKEVFKEIKPKYNLEK
jgi:hypothetical protein